MRWADVVPADEDADAKTKLYTTLRTHVRGLAEKEGKGNLVITWPVNKHLAPLSIEPSVILGARQLKTSLGMMFPNVAGVS